MRKHVASFSLSEMTRRIPSRYCVSDRGEQRETDPRTSNKAPGPNWIRLRIGALPLECRMRCFRGRDGDNARHPKQSMRRRLRWRRMDGAELPDADILEDWLEQLASHFDRAARIAEAQETVPFKELGLQEPMIGHETPPPVSRHK